MKSIVKQLVKDSPFYHPVRNWQKKRHNEADFLNWQQQGQSVPPPHKVKQLAIREHAKRFGLRLLVETGTYYGDMVEAMKNDFDQIFSIELSAELFEAAKKRFAGDTRITLINGDSGSEIKQVVDSLTQPALFWLDGHYSAGVTACGDKETPIFDELMHILQSPIDRHVMIIDDARCFGTDPAYPTVDEVKNFVASIRPSLEIAVQDDSIRIAPAA